MMTVLIVDPDPDSVGLYIDCLCSHGIHVVCDGDPSADLLLPDVVVYGTDSCAGHNRIVRIVKGSRTVPTIVITSDNRDRRRPLTHGFDKVLVRPVAPDALLRNVRRVAAATRSRRSRARAGSAG